RRRAVGGSADDHHRPPRPSATGPGPPPRPAPAARGHPPPGRRPPRQGDLMRLFDPHIHMTSRTTDDYQAMYTAGVRAVVEPAFWLGQPRTSPRSEEHTSELQSRENLVCRLLLEKKK